VVYICTTITTGDAAGEETFVLEEDIKSRSQVKYIAGFFFLMEMTESPPDILPAILFFLFLFFMKTTGDEQSPPDILGANFGVAVAHCARGPGKAMPQLIINLLVSSRAQRSFALTSLPVLIPVFLPYECHGSCVPLLKMLRS
jgi:hypothetical protein